MKILIAFFEIPTIDFRRAVNFYEAILHVRLLVSECEEEKMACFMEEGEAIGAIFNASGYSPSGKGILIDFNVMKWRILFKKITKGGKIIIPKTKIQAESKGYFAVLADPEGNRSGLYADK